MSRPQLTKSESFLRGSFLGNYCIAGKLGEGSFGKVLLGLHKDTQKKVALKCIEMKNTKVANHVMRETKLQKLLDHPNIVHLYEVFQVAERNATVMVLEHIDGGELFDYIVTKGKVEEKEAIRLFRQMISAIEYCHYNLVIHRDLKPENILLDENKNVKIMDFGLANMMHLSGEFLHTNCGSPIYSSPEILSSKDYIGPEVDIWSLGIILYVMVTGMCPWSGTTLTEQLKNAVVGRFEPPEGVSLECSNLIDRILTVDAKKRPTIEEIRHHPWVNRGYATKPISCVNPSSRTKITHISQIDDEILNQMVEFGFQKMNIINDLMNMRTAQQTFVLYYLMLDHKEKEEKKDKAQRTALTKTWSPSDFEKLRPDDGGALLPSPTSMNSERSNGNSMLTNSMQDKPRPKSKDDTLVLPPIPNIQIDDNNSKVNGISTLLSGMGLNLSSVNNNNNNNNNNTTTSTPTSTTNTTQLQPIDSTNSTSSTSSKKRISMNIENLFHTKFPQSKKMMKPRIVKRTFLLEKATSKKSLDEIQVEVERVIGFLKMPFKQNGLKYTCKEDILEDKLKFDVEICKVEKEELIGVSFKRKSGSIFHYKDVVDRFCNVMAL